MAGTKKMPECTMEAASSSDESDSLDYSVASNSDEASPVEEEVESSPGPSADPNQNLENTNILRRKLIESGQLERLKELMERRLLEVGWRGRMIGKCRAIAQKTGQDTTYEMLYQPLQHEGKDMIPSNIKYDILEKIMYCYHSETRRHN